MANFPIVVDVMVKGLDEIKRLVGATDEAASAFDNAGEAADGAAKEFEGAGKASEEAGKKIKGAGKGAKDAGVDLERAASQFRAMGSAGTLAGDSLERLSIVTSGPLGAAIGAAVVGFMAFKAGIAAARAAVNGLTASVSAYIQTSKPLQKAQGRLNQQFADFKATLGAAITGGESFAKVLDTIGGMISKLTDFIAANSDKILSFVKIAATATALIAKIAITALGALLAPVALAVDGAIKLMSELMEFAGQAQMSIIEFAMALPDSVIEAAGFTQEGLRRMYNSANKVAGVAGKSSAEAFTNGYTAALAKGNLAINAGIDEINASLQSVTGGTGRVRGVVGGATGGAAPAPGAGMIDPSAMQTDAAIRAGGFAGFAGFALQTGADIAKKRKEDLDRVAAEESAFQDRQLQRMQQQANAQDEIAKQMGGTYHLVVKTLQDTMTEGFDIAKGSLAAATGEVANFFGAFAAGESTLSEFGDAMADLAANIANTFGDLFIKQGIGLALFNPGVGAALIAAGFALKMLGGAVASKGSANRGTGASTGSGASGAAASQAVAREVTRSLRPSGAGGENVTNIEVVIGGRSITPEMVAIVDDIARQRRSRYLGRRMGAF